MEKLNMHDKEKAVNQITRAMLNMYGELPSFVDPVGLTKYVEKSVGEAYDDMIREHPNQCEPVWELCTSAISGILVAGEYERSDIYFTKTKKGNWKLME
jgi:hypothetical protein